MSKRAKDAKDAKASKARKADNLRNTKRLNKTNHYHFNINVSSFKFLSFQTFKIKLFVKIVKNRFCKNVILDIWQDPDYALDSCVE